jgi:hypothetical protein
LKSADDSRATPSADCFGGGDSIMLQCEGHKLWMCKSAMERM